MMGFEMLASFVGWYLLIFGAAMLLDLADVRMSCKSVMGSKDHSLVLAIIKTLVGLYVVHMYNVWEMHWESLITLFGWSYILFGIFRLFSPVVYMKYTSIFDYKSSSGFTVYALVYALAGAYILMQLYY